MSHLEVFVVKNSLLPEKNVGITFPLHLNNLACFDANTDGEDNDGDFVWNNKTPLLFF